MGALLNRRRYMGWASAPLPYDAEIEYLGCTGFQFINTGIVPNASMVWTVDVSISTSYGNINGIYEASNKRYMVGANQNVQFGTDSIFNTNIQNDGGRHTYSIDGPNKKYLFDGTQVGAFTSFPSLSKTIYLMARWINNSTDLRLCGNFYGSTITQQGSFVINMIPVRVGTTGYLYDKVSGTLFGNNGTGSFTLGPDKT